MPLPLRHSMVVPGMVVVLLGGTQICMMQEAWRQRQQFWVKFTQGSDCAITEPVGRYGDAECRSGSFRHDLVDAGFCKRLTAPRNPQMVVLGISEQLLAVVVDIAVQER